MLVRSQRLAFTGALEGTSMFLFFNPITLATCGTDQSSRGGRQETDPEGDASSRLPRAWPACRSGCLQSACIPPGDQGRSARRRDLDVRSRGPIVVGRGPVVCLNEGVEEEIDGVRKVVDDPRRCWPDSCCLGGSDADAAPPESRGLDIYFIDVMGGAATLIVTPERESILIDSGWPGLDDRDPEADRPRAQGPGRVRPSRPPDHDPLAHGPLRRRRRAGQAGRDRALLGPGAARGRRRRASTSPTARRPTIPLGIAYRAGLRRASGRALKAGRLRSRSAAV